MLIFFGGFIIVEESFGRNGQQRVFFGLMPQMLGKWVIIMEKHKDLRIVKTRKAIRNALTEMICDMDYEQISIKELCARAMINRKTFYLHYKDIAALFEELENEIVDGYTRQSISYKSLSDIKSIIRYYFESMAHQPELNERIMCVPSYRPISDRINRRIMEHRKRENDGAFGLNAECANLAFAYFGTCSPNLYRQWVADGKRLPLEELIAMATRLICGGMASVVQGA